MPTKTRKGCIKKIRRTLLEVYGKHGEIDTPIGSIIRTKNTIGIENEVSFVQVDVSGRAEQEIWTQNGVPTVTWIYKFVDEFLPQLDPFLGPRQTGPITERQQLEFIMSLCLFRIQAEVFHQQIQLHKLSDIDAYYEAVGLLDWTNYMKNEKLPHISSMIEFTETALKEVIKYGKKNYRGFEI